MEDCRSLFILEWNCRVIIKKHLQTLLRYKNLYWKKRFTINKIKLGDECTKFFHAMATVSYRRNAITHLKDDHGNSVTDHAGKADLLLVAFRERMGVSLQPHMAFDLQSLIYLNVDLDCLIDPITKEEIDSIIKLIPLDKAPGPNRFNGMFLKKCWPLNKDDFYKLARIFLMAIST